MFLNLGKLDLNKPLIWFNPKNEHDKQLFKCFLVSTDCHSKEGVSYAFLVKGGFDFDKDKIFYTNEFGYYKNKDKLYRTVYNYVETENEVKSYTGKIENGSVENLGEL